MHVTTRFTVIALVYPTHYNLLPIWYIVVIAEETHNNKQELSKFSEKCCSLYKNNGNKRARDLCANQQVKRNVDSLSTQQCRAL